MSKDQPESLTALSRSALAAEVLSLRQRMQQLQGEIIKHQVIAATRLDVIRLLGFIMNRDPAPDPMALTPQTPEVRKIMAAELQNLAKHLHTQAEGFEQLAEKLNAEGESSQEST